MTTSDWPRMRATQKQLHLAARLLVGKQLRQFAEPRDCQVAKLQEHSPSIYLYCNING